MSLTESVAVRLPVAEGVKVTLIVQLCPSPRLEPQLLVWLKSPGFVPVMVIDVMLSVVEFDPLVSVAVIGELLVPTLTLPKVRVAGFSFTTVPVPVSDTV